MKGEAKMLRDLHDVATQARQRFINEFTPTEITLSNSFQDAFSRVAEQDGQSIIYSNRTAVIVTSENKKIYIPNQWFKMAAYMSDFVEEFLKYKDLTLKIVRSEYPYTKDAQTYIGSLKNTTNQEEIDRYTELVSTFLNKTANSNYSHDDVILLVKFATDYSWWYGNKNIDRYDTYLSPVLTLLGVVAQSQGYIADISVKMATNQELKLASDNMISTPEETPALEEHRAENEDRLTGGTNEIVYGAPGTGKSHYLETTYAKNTITTRVVFHPEYTFFDFVGTYKPIPVYSKAPDNGGYVNLDGAATGRGKPIIDYRFIPGPFITCLVDAWLNPRKMYTLLIEEINRANCAAVFGEMFQLLDRDLNGTSEYAVKPSYDLETYLQSIPGFQLSFDKSLRIPSNLNIVATMNSADQGVMPMDSAFKRRWSFVYRKISIEGSIHENSFIQYAGNDVTWGNLVRCLNKKLMSLGVEEDRLIGPYFIKPNELGSKRATDKLLLYLWDDVLRHNREAFFSDKILTFADLSSQFQSFDVFGFLGSSYEEILLEDYKPSEPEEVIEAEGETGNA